MIGDLQTQFLNETNFPVILETGNQCSFKKIKRIEPGKHTNISSWEGFEWSEVGILISYKVYPANRADGRVNASFLPIEVRKSYEIKISCDIEAGFHLIFVPANESFFQRISFVLWVKNLFSYT